LPTVFINNQAIVLPVKFSAGDCLTPIAADLLHEIQIKRIKVKLRWLFQRGEILAEELQTKANELMSLELLPYSSTEDSEEEDPILTEAIIIAREIIVGRMAKEGLPPPKNLDLHAKALVDNSPKLQEIARQRIEAKFQAGAALMKNAI